MPEAKADRAQPQTKAPNMIEIMADFNKAMAFFSKTPAEAWEAAGQKTALDLYSFNSENVTAYKKFLANESFNGKVDGLEDFKKLPISDKYNYIQKYGFNEVNTTKAGEHLYCFILSSGTSDEPTVWSRNFQYEETILPLVCDNYFSLYWNLDKKSTLIINAIALGPWNAGFTMHHALRPLTQKHNMTLSTNGADLDSIVFTIKKFAQYYDQTIIFSYTTFHRTILERLEQEGIDIRKLNLKLFIGGEGSTVEWVRYINDMISGDPDDLTSIIDGYGTSEGSLLGMGSALTNLIRNLANNNKELAGELFGRSDMIPNLFQYTPSSFYIEEINGEIIFTSKSTAPLVRYNLHDRGGVIKFRDMEKILKKYGIDYRAMIKAKGLPDHIIWEQPFAYCFGRRDDTIMVAGANVYPEQISPVFNSGQIEDIHSFKLSSKSDEAQHLIHYVYLELIDGLSYNEAKIKNLQKKYHDIILDRLLKVSSDYAESYRADPVYSDIHVRIYQSGSGPFDKDRQRTKPRLVV